MKNKFENLGSIETNSEQTKPKKVGGYDLTASGYGLKRSGYGFEKTGYKDTKSGHYDIEDIRQVIEEINSGYEDQETKEEEIKKIISEVYELLQTEALENGARLAFSQNDILKLSTEENVVVRSEAPEKVWSIFDKGEEEIEKLEGVSAKYANAILWNPKKGLEAINPVYEGRRSLEGFFTTVGFKPSEVVVSPVDEETYQQKSALSLRKGYGFENFCHIDGNINKEDIKFLLTRMPAKYFPEEEMTDEELEDFLRYQKEMTDFAYYEQEKEEAKRRRMLAELPVKSKPAPFFIYRAFIFDKEKDDNTKSIAA